MVLDRLENAHLYYGLGERIARGLRALESGALAGKPDGRYELEGDALFALVQRYDTKPADLGKWEAHRRYIDIQYVAEGVEVMGHAPLREMTATEGYETAKDVGFFAGHGDFVTVSAGMFTIFFPQDVHMPTLAVGAPGRVVKVVVKVAVG